MNIKNILLEKSFIFAKKIVVFRSTLNNHKFDAIYNQLLKSGTSISANLFEAEASQSRADFILKITISYKETKETIFWLKLLKEKNLVIARI